MICDLKRLQLDDMDRGAVVLRASFVGTLESNRGQRPW